MKATRNIVCIALAAVCLGGCSNFSPPRFRAVEVRALEPSAAGAVLVFVVEATNPNAEPMPLRRAHYTLSLEGKDVFTADRSPEATIRRFGTQRFELPAVIPFGDTPLTGPVRYEIRGYVTYETPGELNEVLFDSGLRVPQGSLSIGGTVDFGPAGSTPSSD